MHVLRSSAAVIAALGFAVLLGACVKDAPTVLKGAVSATEDANGSSPVVVRYYELKTTKAFDSAGFFDIYETAPATLGADLLNWGEVELLPGSTEPLQVELNSETRFVGFLAAYRDIENSKWRAKMPVNSQSVNGVAVSVGNRALAVTPG